MANNNDFNVIALTNAFKKTKDNSVTLKYQKMRC